MKKIIYLFICFIFLCNFFAFSQNVSRDFVDGEVYMKIKKEIPFTFDTLHKYVDIRSKLSFLIPLISKYNITKAEASFYFSKSDILKRTFRIHFGKSELIERFIAEMKSINQIEYVEKIPLMRINYTPDDLLPNRVSNGQYALYNIKAQDAWDISRGSHSVTIAIVDNAIDIDHIDLAGNVIAQRDVADDDDDPTPPTNSGWGHGTHTSGIACATSDNGTGIASIGFNCGLMAVKVTHDSGNPGVPDNGYEGILWAVSNGASVISCSWSGPGSSLTEQLIIDDAYDHGAIVVATAGNDNNDEKNYPAAYNHVVAVASVSISDTKGGTSCFGSWVDVSAPGVDIFSTLPNNQYGSITGTSMAAPLVAGLCGLVISLDPSLSNDEVVSIVVNSADNIDAQNPGFEGKLGSGRINAYRALESALTCNPSINLGTGTYTTLKTESSGTITSKNSIPANSQVIFDAANMVNLLPGFIAKNGCVFRAYIDGCGNKFAFSYHNDNKENIKRDNMSETQNNISISSSLVSPVNVSPNPARDKINVRYQLNDGTDVTLLLRNSKGITVYKSVAGKKVAGLHTTTIDVSTFSNGIYFMEFKTNNETKTNKIIIQH